MISCKATAFDGMDLNITVGKDLISSSEKQVVTVVALNSTIGKVFD